MSLGSQIKKYREKFGMTLEQLEEASGVPWGTIAALEARGSVRSKYATAIAKGFGLTLEQLEDESADYERDEKPKLDNNIEPAYTHSRYVPLVSWVQAGNWESPMDDRDKYDMVHCPIKQHSEKTFALTVRGISMYDPGDPRSFEEGDTIFVDPCREARSGNMVVAMHDGSFEATFKQLIIEDGKQYLRALNPNWQPNIQEIEQETYICGVVIARIKTTTYV